MSDAPDTDVQPDSLRLEDLPGSLARALDALDPGAPPQARHTAALEAAKQLVVFMADVLDSAYAAHREEHGPMEAVEDRLQKMDPAKPRTLGLRWGTAWTVWKAMREVGHPFDRVPVGKSAEHLDFAAFSTLWTDIKEAWHSTPGDPVGGANFPYEYLAAKSGPPTSKKTQLGPFLDDLLNHRNVHAHAAEGVELKGGGPKRRVEFAPAYYAVFAEPLAAATQTLARALHAALGPCGLLKVERTVQPGRGAQYEARLHKGLGRPKQHSGPVCPGMAANTTWLTDARDHPVLKLLSEPLQPAAPALAAAAPTAATARADSDARPPNRPTGPVFTVPFPTKNDDFVGRDTALATLHGHLTKSRRTAIGQAAAIQGLGGVGKTQLAVEYAHRYRSAYPDGVVWLDLTQPRQTALAAFALAALGGRPDDKPENLAGVARAWLNRHSDYLLVLDNVEPETKLAEWLPNSQPRVLATARHPLGASWSAVPLGMLDRTDAVAMLRNALGDPDGVRHDADDVDALCALLCDFPLALEIAGAWLHKYHQFTLAEYQTLLADAGVQQLSQDGTIGPTQHRACVVATLALNRQQLADQPEVLDLVETLAVWPQRQVDATLLQAAVGFDRPLAFKMPLSIALGLSLVTQSAARSDATPTELSMHPFLKEVVRSGLSADRCRQLEAAWRAAAAGWLEAREDIAHNERVLAHRLGLAGVADTPGRDRDGAAVRVHLAHHATHAGLYADAEALLAPVSAQLPTGPPGALRGRLALVQAQLHLHRFALEPAAAALQAATAALADSRAAEPGLWARTLALQAWLARNRGQYDAAHRWARQAHTFVENALCDDPAARSRALGDFGVTLGLIERNEEALQHHQHALRLATQRLGHEHPYTSTGHVNLGVTLGKLGRLKEALEHEQRALQIATQALGNDHPHTARVHAALGATLHQLDRLQEALHHKQHALRIATQTLGHEHPETGRYHAGLGSILHSLGRFKEALDHEQRALQIAIRVHGHEHPQTSPEHSMLGLTLLELDRHDEALQHTQRALQIASQTLGHEHPETGRRHMDVGAVFFQLGRADEALQHSQHALRIATKTLGHDHPDTGRRHASLGAVFCKLGRYREALQHEQVALRITTQSLGHEHSDTGLVHANLGATLQKLDRLKEALHHKQHALRIATQTLGHEHPETGDLHAELGTILCKLRRFEEALQHNQHALRIATQTLGYDHTDTIRRHALLGVTLQGLGRRKEALDHFRTLERILVAQGFASRAALRDCRKSIQVVAGALNQARPGFRQVSAKAGHAPANKTRTKKRPKAGKKKRRS